MIYNSGYGNGYYPQYYSQYPQQNNVQQVQQQMQIQNGGFISVRSEAEAFNYPVAPGNSVSFKNENAPYVYTKTMGFSQLDRPIFKRFRLVEEDSMQETAQNDSVASPNNNQTINVADYVLKTDFEAVLSEIQALKKELSELKNKSEVVAE